MSTPRLHPSVAIWEGNRRSGVGLAMRHRQQWYYHLRAHGLRKGDEHPAYTPVEHGTVYFFYIAYHSNKLNGEPVYGNAVPVSVNEI